MESNRLDAARYGSWLMRIQRRGLVPGRRPSCAARARITGVSTATLRGPARQNARVPGTRRPRMVDQSPPVRPRVASALHRAIVHWYAEEARALPWRDPDCSAWGVLVSEVMLQQTP